MNKLIFLFLSMSIFTCEKPAPQQPTVISSYTYHDSLPPVKTPTYSHATKDSTITDSISSQNTTRANDHNFITYTNAADRIVHVAYESNKEPRQVKVNFPEQNINEILTETSSGSNIYSYNHIKWETTSNHRTGILTVFGTWFDFIIKD